MAFDFKKEHKELYRPGKKPQIVEVPPMSFVAVRGQGDPDEEGGAYQAALDILYSASYTLKMSHKTDHAIGGFFDYVVPPLEGFWWQDGAAAVDCPDKPALNWISAIRLPGFATRADFEWAAEAAPDGGLAPSLMKKSPCVMRK